MPNLENVSKALLLMKKISGNNFLESPRITIQIFLKKMQIKTYQKAKHKAKPFQNTSL